MTTKLISPDYFTYKSILSIKKASENKFIHNGIYYIIDSLAKSIVNSIFNGNNDIEKHIVNTFRVHIDEICKSSNIQITQFNYGISFSSINALTKSDTYSKQFYKKVLMLFQMGFDFESNRLLNNIDYINLNNILLSYFVAKNINDSFKIELNKNIDEDILNMHKKIYLKALSLTFAKPVLSENFGVNFCISLVNSYENEIYNNQLNKASI